MKIIFMGTPDFAIPSLKALLEAKENLLAVVTQPDRPKGRNLKLSPSPVKELAVSYKIPVYQPQNLSENNFIETIKFLNPDIIIVVAYGHIIPKVILDIPQQGCFNVHASLLPKYRGAAPINWAIINGEEKSGVTTMLIDEGMDTGDILLQEELDILPTETTEELSDKLSNLGAKLLIKTLEELKSGTLVKYSQDHQKATYAPKLKKENGLIDWSQSAKKIKDLVRGLNPWPCAYTYYQGETIKIWDVDLTQNDEEEHMSGEIITSNGKTGAVISTGNGKIILKEVQAKGSKRMDIKDYLRGHRLEKGFILGK